MKIALLIGVSEYDTQQKLPGCKNDVLAIKQIIDATKEYDDKLVIYKNTNSNNIKQQVSAFLINIENRKKLLMRFFSIFQVMVCTRKKNFIIYFLTLIFLS